MSGRVTEVALRDPVDGHPRIAQGEGFRVDQVGDETVVVVSLGAEELVYPWREVRYLRRKTEAEVPVVHDAFFDDDPRKVRPPLRLLWESLSGPKTVADLRQQTTYAAGAVPVTVRALLPDGTEREVLAHPVPQREEAWTVRARFDGPDAGGLVSVGDLRRQVAALDHDAPVVVRLRGLPDGTERSLQAVGVDIDQTDGARVLRLRVRLDGR